MARRVRASTLENRTARLKLTPRKKPYHFTIIAPGIAVGYRRNKGAGKWVLRAADGHGAYWTDTIALADDHEPANGAAVLTFWQAQDKARVLVRGEAAGDRPATVADALDAYERDLATRGGALANARVVRKLIPATLLARPVGILNFHELRHWRDGLLDPRKASSVNRTCKALKAALNLTAVHDPRIGNAAVWRNALTGLPDAHTARRVGLPEGDVRALVGAAHAVDPSLGLWAEVAATTGARPSQIARLDVADLQDDRAGPRLMMPSARKGKGRKRVERPPGADPASTSGQAAGGGRDAAGQRSAADGAERRALERQRSPSSVRPGGGASRARRHDGLCVAPLLDHPRAARRRAGPRGRGQP
jgi:integrase